MTSRHREISDDIVNRLRNSNSVDEYELRKIGGEVYDVMNWLKEYEIITQTQTGRPFTKGKKFFTYTTLDNLLNPPAPEPPKKDWLERTYKFFAIGGVVFAIATGTVTLYRENKYQKIEESNNELKTLVESLGHKTTDLDSALNQKRKELQKMHFKVDSLNQQLKTYGKKEK